MTRHRCYTRMPVFWIALSWISLQQRVPFIRAFPPSRTTGSAGLPLITETRAPYSPATRKAPAPSTTRTVSTRTRTRTCARTCASTRRSSPSLLAATNNVYGKGADIWPEPSNDVIDLSQSFPNGIVPYSAVIAIEQDDMEAMRQQARSPDDKEGSSAAGHRTRTRHYIRRILRMAASKEELENEGEHAGSMGRLPIAVGLSLLLGGLVRPMDVALVACWTAYLTILNMTAQSPRDLGGAPVLPAVPPQGHVPSVLSNPMGVRFGESALYRRWLALGAWLGLLGPIAWLLVATAVLPSLGPGRAGVGLGDARAVARPLFLLCCQATTEAVAKRNLIALPLRVLVPILYNASRLIYLWSWATSTAATTTAVSRVGRCLGIANFTYWGINLFAFLIPIASIRYMRAHFFGVEAEEVTTRPGLEETVGIVPNNILLQ